MGAPLSPGDFVECVDNSPSWEGLPTALTLGAIYTVAIVLPPPVSSWEWGVIINEQTHHPEYNGFLASRFRRLLRPDPSFIESLKSEPVPAPEEPKRPAKVTADIDGRGLVWTGDGLRSFDSVDEAYAFVRALPFSSKTARG